jgi:hypothetical protein
METTVVGVKWAQHKKLVFLTLEAKNLSEEGRSITLTPEGNLHFEGKNRVTNAVYKLDINLFDEVVVETTKWKVTDYCIQFSISKKNQSGEFWPRLTKEKAKFNNITVDWTRWVDEDEADDKQLDYNPDDFDDLPDEDSDDDEEEANLNDLDDDLDKKPEDAKEEEKAEEKKE